MGHPSSGLFLISHSVIRIGLSCGPLPSFVSLVLRPICSAFSRPSHRTTKNHNGMQHKFALHIGESSMAEGVVVWGNIPHALIHYFYTNSVEWSSLFCRFVMNPCSVTSFYECSSYVKPLWVISFIILQILGNYPDNNIILGITSQHTSDGDHFISLAIGELVTLCYFHNLRFIY